MPTHSERETVQQTEVRDKTAAWRRKVEQEESKTRACRRKAAKREHSREQARKSSALEDNDNIIQRQAAIATQQQGEWSHATTKP